MKCFVTSVSWHIHLWMQFGWGQGLSLFANISPKCQVTRALHYSAEQAHLAPSLTCCCRKVPPHSPLFCSVNRNRCYLWEPKWWQHYAYCATKPHRWSSLDGRQRLDEELEFKINCSLYCDIPTQTKTVQCPGYNCVNNSFVKYHF